ncbi:protein RKD1-like [Tasmannia lanceolata]|uniref:protein RKD1-like n=1 Tax=Tasmannia lanceolata TaxID=3420 RepID=UPI00406383A3
METLPSNTTPDLFTVYDSNNVSNQVTEIKKEGARCSRDEEKTMDGNCNGRSRSNPIEFDEISRYFYVPITQAAKQMNIGLTVLKKRCRELGIKRWPHRKMKSLKSLIHNFQELGSSCGHSGDIRLIREIERLEEQKRLMEKLPEMQLTEDTKKLRQACFKANYKKRRMVAIA